MSIDPISPVPEPAFSQSVRESRGASVAEPVAGAEPPTPDALPASPPPEVFAAMLTAARAADRLATTGRALRFSLDGPSGLSVQLTDLDGAVLGTVSPNTVLDIAAGGTLD
ncbi:MAG TPA: hypothetical protein VKV21_14605 [Solirubrobacteraceae bacterium]|nr:hypothetical protein [Solirubrobacteraceae bacterium]